MKPNAITKAQQAARWLQQQAGAKFTITIAADLDRAAHDGGQGHHIVVGTFCPDISIVELLLAATLKKIQEKKAPATVAIGGGRRKRGVW